MKKDGGVIKNWQIHTLSISEEKMKEFYPEVIGKPRLFTGTVVFDPTGRWQPGYHMRSSLIVDLVDVDENTKSAETINTVYTLEGPEGDPAVGNKDLGDLAARITY